MMMLNNVLIPDPDRGHPCVHDDRLTADAARPADVRAGRPVVQVLSDWHADHLVGGHCKSLDWDVRVWGVRVLDAETVRRHGASWMDLFPLCARGF